MMEARENHGVVIVRLLVGTYHRPNSGHVKELMDEDAVWEPFPNRDMAEEAGHKPCGRCFYRVPGDRVRITSRAKNPANHDKVGTVKSITDVEVEVDGEPVYVTPQSLEVI